MKFDWGFPKQVLLTLIIIGGAAAYPISIYSSSKFLIAVIIGALLSTLNVMLGYFAIEYSFNKSTTTFFKYVLGGMGIRMFVMAGVLVTLIKVFQFHAGALVGSMGIFYVLFLTLEVFYIQKKISSKHHH